MPIKYSLQEQILEEIVRECQEIERRSNSSESPVSNWSSDELDSNGAQPYHSYKTPEKKERKKAQNRLAATRYREKKRREREETQACIGSLTCQNEKLKEQVCCKLLYLRNIRVFKVVELEQEVRYFKKFMHEMGMKV